MSVTSIGIPPSSLELQLRPARALALPLSLALALAEPDLPRAPFDHPLDDDRVPPAAGGGVIVVRKEDAVGLPDGRALRVREEDRLDRERLGRDGVGVRQDEDVVWVEDGALCGWERRRESVRASSSSSLDPSSPSYPPLPHSSSSNRRPTSSLPLSLASLTLLAPSLLPRSLVLRSLGPSSPSSSPPPSPFRPSPRTGK